MNDKELSFKLRTDARRIGLCDKWYSDWNEDGDRQYLIDLFKRGLDFCISHRWPDKTFIHHNFDQELLRQNGILIDDTRSFPIRNPQTRRQIHHSDYVLIGESSAVFRLNFRTDVSNNIMVFKYKRPNVCNVWVLDKSSVRIEVKYGAFILVHLFDDATADVQTDLVSKVTVIRHSENTSVKRKGCVTVKDELDYL